MRIYIQFCYLYISLIVINKEIFDYLTSNSIFSFMKLFMVIVIVNNTKKFAIKTFK